MDRLQRVCAIVEVWSLSNHPGRALPWKTEPNATIRDEIGEKYDLSSLSNEW